MSGLLTHRHSPLYFGIAAMVSIATLILLRAPLPAGLAEGHAMVPELSRLGGCVRCHTDEGIDPGCLACHDEIQAQLDSNSGYHAYLAETAEGDRCTSCHVDHFGGHFQVAGAVAWSDLDRDAFDHPHLEFSLLGAHDALECDTCHNPEFTPVIATLEFPEITRKQTFLGLGQDCMECHEDPHAGGLSPTCTECHDQNAFVPAPHFDHDEHYELGCAHDELECQGCHEIPEQAASSELRSLPFDQVRGLECLECHETPHRVEFSKDCFDCHPKKACVWQEGQKAMTASLHEETGFPMGRAHIEVDCAECHPSNLEYALRFPDPAHPDYQRSTETCEGCHDDEHQGQFEESYTRCRECHEIDGFNPSAFSISDHSVWPLEGSHLAVLCGGCHLVPEKENSTRVYVGTETECASCHQDPHLGQFAESAGDDCQRCHSTPVDWAAPGFDHDLDSRFPLDGDHVQVPCASCHPTVERPDGSSVVQYRPLGRECQDCHERPVRKPKSG